MHFISLLGQGTETLNILRMNLNKSILNTLYTTSRGFGVLGFWGFGVWGFWGFGVLVGMGSPRFMGVVEEMDGTTESDSGGDRLALIWLC